MPHAAAAAPARARLPERIRLSHPPVEVEVRRTRGARRLTLSVGRVDGALRITMPSAASLAEAQAFAERHSDWLASALARRPKPLEPRAGAMLPVAGRMLEIASLGAPRARAKIEGGKLWLPGGPEEAPARAKAWLRHAARDALVPAAHGYAEKLGRKVTRITLRDTRSRWGSCTSAGALNFSWRLAMAPPEVLDYVAAHEAAHLVEMNHSPAFWAVVERILPGWQDSRAWLRDHGAELHRWTFDAGSGD